MSTIVDETNDRTGMETAPKWKQPIFVYHNEKECSLGAEYAVELGLKVSGASIKINSVWIYFEGWEKIVILPKVFPTFSCY